MVTKDLPISPRFTPYNFYRDASSALLQLVNQWLNFTYSRSHAFRYERKNTNPTLVRIELTTSALLAGVCRLPTRPLGRQDLCIVFRSVWKSEICFFTYYLRLASLISGHIIILLLPKSTTDRQPPIWLLLSGPQSPSSASSLFFYCLERIKVILSTEAERLPV